MPWPKGAPASGRRWWRMLEQSRKELVAGADQRAGTSEIIAELPVKLAATNLVTVIARLLIMAP